MNDANQSAATPKAINLTTDLTSRLPKFLIKLHDIAHVRRDLHLIIRPPN